MSSDRLSRVLCVRVNNKAQGRQSRILCCVSDYLDKDLAIKKRFLFQ